ncbi:Response regulator receiver domain-containing protein [Nitrosospira multiformis]|uniref:Response regulator receiver domain-containing protein n=1 Tax=Nitrosospira multiformis TaxID=1231 RepID=A0A1H8Q7H1_9PROT|nr:response regulator [Nitrosospira multiformis]SEO49874.1 Response regulator receiver domain-containing protein [Nitrosospira multiformis]
MRIPNKPVLLIEDDQVDMMRVARALKEIGVENPVVHRENGEDALNYLQDENSGRPCIILLDLNMPVMNGIEFLRAVKKDERLRRIPVVILTTSDNHEDKLSSFNSGAAGYIEKPAGYRQFVEVMRSIDAYWTISQMP